MAERLLKTWPVGLRTTGGVGEQPFTAGLFQRILLQRESLIMSGNAGIANKHGRIV